jgi:hypothetical protein
VSEWDYGFVATVCEVCGANLYTVNLEVHLRWHEANDRSGNNGQGD